MITTDIDPSEKEFIDNTIGRNMHGRPVVFDIGGSAGAYTTYVLSAVPRAQVHIFEARPLAARSLSRRFKKQTVVSAAVSSEQGRSTFTVAHGLEHSHLGDAAAPGEKVINVKTVTVDGYSSEMGIHNIDLLKMDVEGGEPLVLLGAAGMLESGGVTSLQFEYGSTWMNYDEGQLFATCDMLIGYGYALYEWQEDEFIPYVPINDYAWRNIFASLIPFVKQPKQRSRQ